jgi:hypothetical protein
MAGSPTENLAATSAFVGGRRLGTIVGGISAGAIAALAVTFFALR